MTACSQKEDTQNEFQVFGTFQSLQFFLICLPLFIVSMTHVNYIFVAEDVNYRCLVPECEVENNTINKPDWWPDNIDSRCSRPIVDTNKFKLSNDTCTNETFYEVISVCDEWIYEHTNSIVSELNLACQSWKTTLVGSVHNAGMIVSMLFTGWISDKYEKIVKNTAPPYYKKIDCILNVTFGYRIGRKPTTIICSIGGCIGVTKIFITNYYAYLAVEFFESLMASGLYTVAVVLMIEVGGDSKRVLTGVIFSYAIYVGEVVFALIAMGLKYWKSIILVVYAPLILFVTYVVILRESTRWQILRGKINEAKDTLKLIAKFNKIDLDAANIDSNNSNELRLKFNIEEQNEKESIKVIFNSKEILIRLAVASFCFFTSSFLYYGSVVHAVLLPGNKYTNFILASLTSFPGDLIAYFTFEKFGRKITLQYGYVISAVFLIAQHYAPESMTWLKLVLFLIGKLGVVICFTGIYTYSLELFPTSVRGSLLGWGNTAARIGSMLAPLTPLLITELDSLPSILFSSTAIISALLLTFTPETKELPMFDTVAQIEAYRESNKAS